MSTELPPIIERLDALNESDEELPGCAYCDCDSFHIELSASYEDLRADLLRLQEERDDAQRALSQGGWKAIAETNSELADHWKQERDALLEALKEAQEWLWDRDKNAHAVANAESMIAAAIANVEGKE